SVSERGTRGEWGWGPCERACRGVRRGEAPRMNMTIWHITWFTVACAAAATAIVLPFGVGLAWLLARRRFPGRSVVETLVSLPLAIYTDTETGRDAEAFTLLLVLAGIAFAALWAANRLAERRPA